MKSKWQRLSYQQTNFHSNKHIILRIHLCVIFYSWSSEDYRVQQTVLLSGIIPDHHGRDKDDDDDDSHEKDDNETNMTMKVMKMMILVMKLMIMMMLVMKVMIIVNFCSCPLFCGIHKKMVT